ncbi:Mitochondrial chaperone BCS1 [Trichoplax sp. H2]|uniref:Mitochondrial chaperone BCS1 n=1 Tax=Trichoplax adhaerens TaxID=10228 RepID=B3RWT7_TRIAD|nr:hypothetical protein TRIADDRAFT_25447 [Trichoplax adhaerens]EDV25183.1 hypothetical protein TRIADDRAFT_25447 [Trichoplax adhaerens]RDD44603.1 Mitochondrial chaperone BCS1 [Trichoplax sp. H2]|eukprot:XP_002113073.1 hypothetical protein TRIADDRAFT_25447 [Trichoplax adhaerens]
MLEALGDNPYFSAGFGLAGIGLGITMLRKGLQGSLVLAKRNLLRTLEVTSKDPSYPWVLQWITEQGSKTQHVTVQTKSIQLANGRFSTEFSYSPCPGRHFIRYKGNWLSVERIREKQMLDLTNGVPFETVTFTAIGKDLKLFENFLYEAKLRAESLNEGKTVIYTSWGTEWRPFGLPRLKRNIKSVILQDGLAEKIMDDIHDFLTNTNWYRTRGIPYRRGYLLYGPPGSGKTSFITAVAGELDYNICILNLSQRGLTDDSLIQSLSTVPHQSIVLLEDIDVAFMKRDAASVAKGFVTGVTFSGLLNALDGVASSEQRLVFMTTNHIDRLDPALIRPGRVDMKCYLGDADANQMVRMFNRFFPDSGELANTFVKNVTSAKKNVSMAALQGYLMCYKNEPEMAVKNANEI